MTKAEIKAEAEAERVRIEEILDAHKQRDHADQAAREICERAVHAAWKKYARKQAVIE